MVEAGRRRVGVKGTYEPQTMKDILAHLKAGGTVGFVLDQYTGPPVGVRVPFFGIPVGTGLALATLVKRTGFPVIPVVNFRTPDGRMVTRVEAPLEWIEDPDPRRELARNTARYAEVLERIVREFPEQWLWSHRRFKGDLGPLGELEWEEGRK
jgi:KDO2-lipid IV(A) lauroyltransferase